MAPNIIGLVLLIYYFWGCPNTRKNDRIWKQDQELNKITIMLRILDIYNITHSNGYLTLLQRLMYILLLLGMLFFLSLSIKSTALHDTYLILTPPSRYYFSLL